jgi:hypothetical protein
VALDIDLYKISHLSVQRSRRSLVIRGFSELVSGIAMYFWGAGRFKDWSAALHTSWITWIKILKEYWN